jgi:hypothetical protein
VAVLPGALQHLDVKKRLEFSGDVF